MALAISDDEKKKYIALGVLLLALAGVAGFLYFPRGESGSEGDGAPAGNTTASAPAGDPAAGGAPAPGADPAAGGTAPAAAAPGGITAASLVSLERYRNDPFEPFLMPPPPPPPPPPVSIPGPVEIVPPSSIGSGGVGIPPMGIGSSGSGALVQLPPIVPRRVAVAPTAPKLFTLPGDQGTGGSVLRSQNKRLSGVVIGDSVRALLEVTVGDKVTTRVVQPGDDVDGIRILRLERVVEAGQTVTRLVIRENNQEQYVELRPAPQQQQNPGMEGLVPGGMPPF